MRLVSTRRTDLVSSSIFCMAPGFEASLAIVPTHVCYSRCQNLVCTNNAKRKNGRESKAPVWVGKAKGWFARTFNRRSRQGANRGHTIAKLRGTGMTMSLLRSLLLFVKIWQNGTQRMSLMLGLGTKNRNARVGLSENVTASHLRTRFSESKIFLRRFPL